MTDDIERPRRVADSVDWGLAISIGKKIAPPGPATTGYSKEQAREELSRCAVAAEEPVRAVTGLADGLPVPTALVLNRPEWIGHAAHSMSAMLSDPEDRAEPVKPGLTGRLGGVQAGGLLAFLSTAILGQYDPFSPDPESGNDGVLMLVVPNVIAVERALKVVPADFRLWVCLHEVTHRVQFSANPWLRDYMRSSVSTLTSETGESTTEIVARIAAGIRSDRPREKGVIGAMQLLQTPEQYEAFENIMMLGTLLEGHADHVMDAVGPSHVPTVATIREAFDARRRRPQNPLQRLVRALLGMDAKIDQYVRGKAFVDEVVQTVGMQRFNAIWSGQDTLPKPVEIETPRLWVDRVL